MANERATPEALTASRDDFEAFIAWSRAGKGKARTAARLERDGHGYADESTQRHWWTWQHARTALLAGGFSLDRLSSEVLNERPALASRPPSEPAPLPDLPLPIGQIVGRRHLPHDTDEFWGYFREGYEPTQKEEVYTTAQMQEYARTAIAASGNPATTQEKP